MINLLATSRKSQIIAARVNLILVRYIGIILLALIFMSATLFISYTVLRSTLESAQARVEASDVKADVYSQTSQQVAALSAQLSEAKTVLSQDVHYSRILTQIGQLIPAGVVLNSLDITESSINGIPLTIKAYARSTSEATRLQTQLQSSPLFTQVSLQDTASTGGIDGYPAVITLSVSLNRAGVQ